MNFINIFDVNNDQSYPPKVLKNEHFSGLIIIKGGGHFFDHILQGRVEVFLIAENQEIIPPYRLPMNTP